MADPVPSGCYTGLDPLAVRFAAAMARFTPFERAPHLAVAASGGADSTALTALACEWAAARGGMVTALVVDHGLRPESVEEARQTRGRLEALGAAVDILTWIGPKPGTGIQAAARAARYALLGEWCASAGVLHLLVAHHADDQAETVALRTEQASGPVGLAGMSAVVERADYRLLRPLLGETRRGLRDYVASRGLAWIEDPSNNDPRFARARLRARSAVAPLPGAHEQAARLRCRLEARRLELLAQAATLHPLGFATFELGGVAANDPDAPHALGALIAWAGGRAHMPATRRLEDVWRALYGAKAGKAATLGGCRIQRRGRELVVVRETGRLPAPSALAPGQKVHWDGRFLVSLTGPAAGPVMVAPLGMNGWESLQGSLESLRDRGAPRVACAALPALWLDRSPVSVPMLGWTAGADWRFSAVLRPRRTLVSPTFAVA